MRPSTGAKHKHFAKAECFCFFAILKKVEAHFTITRTPEGEAPQAIREQWIDMRLPIRKLHAGRLMYGYIGRRFMPVPEDHSIVDAISGEPPKSHDAWGPVEVRGWDAVETLEQAGRRDAAGFWTPHAMGLLAFRLYEGTFSPVKKSR